MGVNIEQLDVKNKFKPLQYGKTWDNYIDDYKYDLHAKRHDYDFKDYYINSYKPFMEHCRRLAEDKHYRNEVQAAHKAKIDNMRGIGRISA